MNNYLANNHKAARSPSSVHQVYQTSLRNCIIYFECPVERVVFQDCECLIISPFIKLPNLFTNKNYEEIFGIPNKLPATVVCIRKNIIYIHSSLYRHKDIFFLFNGKSLYISTSIIFLLGINKLDVNNSYCRRFIFGISNSVTETPIKGIYRIPTGTKFKWDGSKYSLACSIVPNSISNISLSEFSDRLISLIFANLEAINTTYGETKVMLSGGLDSTFLTECLKSRGLSFQAFHVLTPTIFGEGETETLIAHARELGLDVQFVQPFSGSEGQMPVSSNRVADPSDIDVLPLRFWPEDVNPEFFDNRVVIDGHGGDSVFFSGGHPLLPFEILLQGNVNGALDTLNSFCRTRGLTYWQWFESLIHKREMYREQRLAETGTWLSLETERRIESHPMLRGCKGSRRAHISGILEMVCANREFDDQPGRQVFHPLAFPNIINLALSLDKGLFFRGGIDRFCQRNAALSLSGSSYAHRISKREASSVMFAALSQEASRLQDEIRDSEWLDAVGIRKRQLAVSLKRNSSIGISQDFSSIIRCIQVSRFFDNFRNKD